MYTLFPLNFVARETNEEYREREDMGKKAVKARTFGARLDRMTGSI